MTNQQHPQEPIAIVGSACRFPGGSSSPSKLWDLLRQPRDVLKEFDPDRLNLQRFHHADGDTHGSTDVTNKSYLLIEDSRLFDASFFGISPVEAAGMDPQQRVLLETVYESFESAGMTLDQLKGSLTSVYVGVMTNDYSSIQLRDPETVPKYAATGTANSIISNRISYVFDLKGPSETIDTACSSSLVALHHAAQGLLCGDSETAIVAGVNLIFDPILYITESKLHMLSPDSRSKMWDKDANGYSRGEGASALILKPLSRALRDGDHIEGLIRSTCVNSDGQSPGITMPFAPAQAALIRQTYRRAGLDPIKDRPQYFECHGTGTPAGDPVEARAISEALIGTGGETSAANPLYVGSIKTVIGHLEGCAGLAGVMKVLLAIKNRTIPANMLFNELNPAIAPYYGPLRIPTSSIPWPELPVGSPARASVNSFGFGGTNAHVIIESYGNNAKALNEVANSGEGILGPFLFSAGTGKSLLQTVKSYLKYLIQNPSIDLRDLSWMLQARRSTHRVRAHFSGDSRDAVLENMATFVSSNETLSGTEIGSQPRLINSKEVPGKLAVFTGQGAQWASMGRELFNTSPLFRQTIGKCEAVLAALPKSDAPQWSLSRELFADASSSRLSEAVISQPLCTALQLALVDLLTASGITFDAVVGHSSGEIAATYCSGIINLSAAMQIAYYRGLYAKLAVGAKGERGGMLAAGLSLEEAVQLCRRPEFAGRIRVAASNAPRTVTLSGNIDAIEEAKQQFDDDNIFNRQLKVDTAYHSHHMKPCAEPYLKSLLACNIEIRQPKPGKCVWNSSLRGDIELLKGDLSSLKGPYWVANMVDTVLFSQAIDSSIWHGGPFDLAIEVGPHPALKGPTEQTLKVAYGSVPEYTGTLKRGGSDVEAFSAAIGNCWAQLGPQFVNFAGYRAAFHDSDSAGASPAGKVIKDLPQYSWDHDKVYWRESRISRRYRTGRDTSHELLGRRAPDDNDHELRWRNVLKLSEMPWLRGHQVLEQVLLPGASYVSIALEASKHLATLSGNGRPVRLLEVENVEILRPVVVPDNHEGVETLFTARLLNTSSTIDDVLRIQFSYYICNDQSNGSMIHTCSGDLSVYFGAKFESGSEEIVSLPLREPVPTNLVAVDCARAYSMFTGIGLDYSGSFRGITESRRCLDYANATGTWAEGSLSEDYVVHPAMLDVAFQTLFIARAHPASSQISSALLPSRIDRVRVDPSVNILQSRDRGHIRAEIETWAVKQTATSLLGDLNIYDSVSGKTFLQVEGLDTRMVGEPDVQHDRPIFAKTVWGGDVSLELKDPLRNSTEDAELLRLTEALERAALFYVRRLIDQIGTQDRTEFQWYHQHMLEAFEGHLTMVRNGQHPVLQSEWLTDTPSMLQELDAQYPNHVELQIIHAVGNNMAGVVRGETQLLEVMGKDDMLNRFYMEDSGCVRINQLVSKVLQDISFKFPRCKVLEIGAGTGGTTWTVMNEINDAYDSYTYTDISSGFFPNAAEKFSDFAGKMIFKTLDVEKKPSDQGFVEQSYDVVIAANVLHATHNLQITMENVRSLLRPGGYLLLFETTGIHTLRVPFSFGGFPGWWLGEETGRRLKPIISSMDWDMLLDKTGFSGVDKVIHDVADEDKHTLSLIISQAVDDNFMRLRDPLCFTAELPPSTEPILLIGGKKLLTSKVISEIQKLLPRHWKRQIQVASSIDNLDTASFKPGMNAICVHEADEPLFANTMTAQRLQVLQSFLMNTRNLLWVTSTGKGNPPRANMFHGIARVVPTELPHLHLQVLGLETGSAPTMAARHCVEAFLRLKETAELTNDTLWSHEPEMELLANGQVVIPRVVPDSALNEVYIASKRTVTKTVDATDIAVYSIPGPAKMILQATNLGEKLGSSSQRTRIQVKYSLQIPAEDAKSIFLACGHLQGQDAASASFIAISSVNASVIEVDPDNLVSIDPKDCTPRVLVATANHMLMRALSTLAEGVTSLLLFPGGNAAYFSSSSPDAVPDAWIKIHSGASNRAIRKMLPFDIQLFVDCTGYLSGASMGSSADVSDAIQACLPAGCAERKLDAFLLQDLPSGNGDFKVSLLEESYSYTKQSSDVQQLHHFDSECEVIKAGELAGADISSLMGKKYVTDWEERSSLRLTVPTLDLRGIFSPDKTYLMVGAAGGLGFSICQWVIRNGAKHMVITSRNPQIDVQILEDARLAGADVRILPMDVSNKESVEAVVKTVRETMPPIGGVCNAAMVLSDKLFLDMGVDQLNKTLVAKVDGTEYLDAAFADTPLDFFIMLSSSATTVGNIGQANYHAANLFMTSLAYQRRSRGLAASIIHVGYVSDVGYVTRNQNRQLDEHFYNMRLMALSETDVHHAFAEAIRGGKPGSTSGSHDIIMGLEPSTKPVAPDTSTPWLVNPRFSHLIPPSALHAQQEHTLLSGNVKQQIEDAKTEEEAVSAVLEAFCIKLESILQLPAGSVNANAQQSIIDLGIDSLVAVEIRTWFLKELGAEVPVLKILGGDTVVQICTAATKKVMAKNLKAQETQQTQATAEAAKVDLPISSPTPARSTDSPVSFEIIDKSPASASITGSQNEETDSSAGKAENASSESSYGKIELSDADAMSEASSCSVVGKDEDVAVDPEVIREERMSLAQARIWFSSKYLDDAAAYNMVFHYRVRGPLSKVRLQHALRVTTQHHECLRMCFYPRVGDGHPMQGVMALSAYEMKHVPDADEKILAEELSQFKSRKWNLEIGQTLGVVVLSRSPEEHDIVFGYHHIVTDVVGWYMFLQDLDKAYRMHPLDKKIAGSHIDYSALQQEQESTGIFDEQLSFWQSEFKTLPEPLPLLPMATVNTRPAQLLRYENHHVYRALEQKHATAIKKISERLRISPFHFHLAVLQVLLVRYTNTDEICIGLVDANRSDNRFAQTVGCFVNMLPVRFNVLPGSKFSDVARTASRKALAAFANAAVPFDMILDKIKAPRSSESTPLFQVAVNYRTGGFWDLPLGECRMNLSLDDGKEAETPYDISLGISDTATGFTIEMHCQTSLYSSDACSTLLDSYLRLLKSFSTDPDMDINECEIHDGAGVAQALELGQGPNVEFGWPETLSERVLDMCSLHLSEHAVSDKATTISYAQLAARIHTLAQALLRDREVVISGSSIAVLCEPSVDAIVAMLAILHVGAIYVPLDISLPSSRHAAIVQSCQPVFLLCHSATKGLARDLALKIASPIQEVYVDVISEAIHSEVRCAAKSTTPAVLLFTSGSTGTPKGIYLSQKNFVNHIALKTSLLNLGQESVLQQSSLGFDMSLVQTFCALANGGRLVIAPAETRRDPVEMSNLVSRNRISLSIATPSEYLAWLRYGAASLRENTAWRHACMGGELVSQQLKSEMRRLGLKGLRMTNCYGPTEITAAATFHTIQMEQDEDEGARFAVGKALPNYSVCVLNAAGRPQPVQHTGEICIGGAGVSQGYLNLEDETNQKFINDFAKISQGVHGPRMYRTGDRGRLTSDGTLLCFGRLEGDTQVKLRGLRIELQEVEIALLQAANGLLSTAIVSSRSDFLVAHATLSPRKDTVSKAELADILSHVGLPQYAIPATIVILPTLPTNSNGKIDRRAIKNLPLPQSAYGSETSTRKQKKMTLREGELRLLWERVLPETLGIPITPASDFFMSGGNSLLLMKLQSAIKESMSVMISTRVLYQASKLREMAVRIDEQREVDVDDIQEIDWKAETAPPAWLLDQISERVKLGEHRKSAKENGIEVLMTGATSFLGGRLLQSLLRSSAVSKIHCIAVLADEQHLVSTNSKIECYTGSLLSPTLGLSTSERESLEQTVDVIIHAGSSGHCLNTYASIRAPNLLSTQLLASLALPHSIPLLFLSSNRVPLLSGNAAPPPSSVSAFPPPTDGSDGYTSTKWASETFLENLAAHLNLAPKSSLHSSWIAAVHRPCVVVSEQAPNSDAMNAILRYSVLMRCMPRLERAEGYLDFGQVDSVVDEIAEAALQLARSDGENEDAAAMIRFRHHSGGFKVPIKEFRAHMESVYGGAFDEIDMVKWLSRAADAGIDPLIIAYLEGVLDNDSPMMFPYLGSK